jgi:hypothetical protein
MTMFSNTRITGFVILLSLLVIMCSSDKGNTPPVDEPVEKSRVWIDTVNVVPGEQARVEIFADLKSPLQGIQLPLILKGSHFTIDSASFVGTLLSEKAAIERLEINQQEGIVDVFKLYDSTSYIPRSSGVLMFLFVTVDGLSQLHSITVDTVTIVRGSGNNFRFVLSDNEAVEIIVSFTPGIINIAP